MSAVDELKKREARAIASPETGVKAPDGWTPA
jgi:hypothetical protein